jgi:hypothetical protein
MGKLPAGLAAWQKAHPKKVASTKAKLFGGKKAAKKKK